LAIKAYQAEGSRPTEQIYAWVDTLDEIRNKDFDLSSSNPHRSSEQDIPKPWELTASLLERIRELNSIVEELHHSLSNGEEE